MSPAAQVIDRTPFALPANVKRCDVFRRSEFIGPVTSSIVEAGGIVFEMIVPDSDHVSVVTKSIDAAVALAKGYLAQ